MSTRGSWKLDVFDDVVELCHTGRFELEYAQQAIAAVTENRQRHPRTFVLSAAGSGPSPEARKYMTEWLKATPLPIEAAVWGAGPVHRAMSEMMMRAVHFFRPNQFVVTFHATREEALAWIAAQRDRPAPRGASER